MVFKVKQRGQESYWDQVDSQIHGPANPGEMRAIFGQPDSAYKFEHNWPYDYVSFVEMIKVNSEIKFSENQSIIASRAYNAYFDLSKSNPGTLKLQNMLSKEIPPILRTPGRLRFNPLASLKGLDLEHAKQIFIQKKIKKGIKAPSLYGTSTGTKRAPSRSSVRKKTQNVPPTSPTSGRNSGGGSNY